MVFGQITPILATAPLPPNTTQKPTIFVIHQRGGKVYIESHYYDNVAGDKRKANQVYELWRDVSSRRDFPTTIWR